MTTRVAVDTSVAVPLLVATHSAHADVEDWANRKELVLSGHAIAETYSVLTRLPGDARVAPADAAMLIDENFTALAALGTDAGTEVHRVFATTGIAGGAVYDGLVALAAQAAGLPLATRDARARSTYEALGVAVTLVDS